MTIRVGLVGAGVIGARRAAVVQGSPDSELRIVADVDLDRARTVAGGSGIQATSRWEDVVSSDVDVVIVATPNKYARPIATAAATAGKHVLCEKPLGRNPAEAEAMIAAARHAGVKLKTGFNHRHHPAIAKAHALVTAGSIGEPMFLRCVYGHGGRPGYDKEWRGNPDLAGGGELLDQGVHVMDLSRWFLGDFTEVSGVVARWFWDIEPLEDNGFAMMRTAAGQVALVHTSWTQWKNRFSFEVFGRDGYVRVEGLGGSYGVERLSVGRRRAESGPPEEHHEEFPGEDLSWREEWAEFVDAVRHDREPLANGVDGLEALRLVHAVYAASNAKAAVALAPQGF